MIDSETSLLENLVAVNLLRKYGREDAVFFYNKGVEVDFYIPDQCLAIQVSYSIEDNDTYEREIGALLKVSSVIECNKLMVITRDEEKTIEAEGKTIDVLPVWKWLLI